MKPIKVKRGTAEGQDRPKSPRQETQKAPAKTQSKQSQPKQQEKKPAAQVDLDKGMKRAK